MLGTKRKPINTVISGIPQVLPPDLTRRCCSETPPCEGCAGKLPQAGARWENHTRRDTGTSGAGPGSSALGADQSQGNVPREDSPGKGNHPRTLQPQESVQDPPVEPKRATISQLIHHLPDPADHKCVAEEKISSLLIPQILEGFFHPMRGTEAYFSLPILLLQKNPPNHRILFSFRTWG